MVNNVEVSKDIPMPDLKRKYPYATMEVGDSFFVTGIKLQLVCNYNYRFSKKLRFKFIARQEDDGIRVWRTE